MWKIVIFILFYLVFGISNSIYGCHSQCFFPCSLLSFRHFCKRVEANTISTWYWGGRMINVNCLDFEPWPYISKPNFIYSQNINNIILCILLAFCSVCFCLLQSVSWFLDCNNQTKGKCLLFQHFFLYISCILLYSIIWPCSDWLQRFPRVLRLVLPQPYATTCTFITKPETILWRRSWIQWRKRDCFF